MTIHDKNKRPTRMINHDDWDYDWLRLRGQSSVFDDDDRRRRQGWCSYVCAVYAGGNVKSQVKQWIAEEAERVYDACHAMPWCQEGDSKDIINTRAKMIIPMIWNLMPLHSRRVLSTARIELAKNRTSLDGNTLATQKPTFKRRIIQQDI